MLLCTHLHSGTHNVKFFFFVVLLVFLCNIYSESFSESVSVFHWHCLPSSQYFSLLTAVVHSAAFIFFACCYFFFFFSFYLMLSCKLDELLNEFSSSFASSVLSSYLWFFCLFFHVPLLSLRCFFLFFFFSKNFVCSLKIRIMITV